MDLLTTILAFAVTLGILIVVHEYGHYLAARLFGVKVLSFSIGFGRKLFSYRRKNDPDATEWSLSAIPLGGYVRMLQENGSDDAPISEADKPKSFDLKPAWQRLIIVLAGPAANLLFAVLAYSTLYLSGITVPEPIVGEAIPETPAFTAGIREGDRFESIGGQKILTFNDIRTELVRHAGGTVTALVTSEGGSEREVVFDLTGIKLDKPDREPLEAFGIQLNMSGTVIKSFPEDKSPARDAGIVVGDEILAVNGRSVKDGTEFIREVQQYPGVEVSLLVKSKDASERIVTLTPYAFTRDDGRVVGRIGAGIGIEIPLAEISYGPLESLKLGFEKTRSSVDLTLRMVGKMITGDASVKNLSGPVMIADVAGQSVKAGWEAFLSFLAVVSVSLGVLNLMPVPILDGCHVLYYSIETIFRRPVPEKFREYAAKVGAAVLIGLMLLAFYNDFARLFHF